jgi:hypothetical protein
MLDELIYTKITEEKLNNIYGSGGELGMGLVTAFAIIAIVTVVIYKIYGSKSGDVTLPGGFKFKFTT